MLRPGELVIHDGNYHEFLDDQVVDGERKSRGLIPRNYETHPVGYLECAPAMHAVDMPLIPRSEWSERIRDMVATKSQLSDIRLTGNAGDIIPALDQGRVGYCHTADTECLTDKGWVRWDEYNWKDFLATVNQITGLMEFQPPLQKHVYEYNGEMIYSTNRRVKFGVTPDHKMLVRKWDERKRTLSKSYTIQRAGDLGWYLGLKHAPDGFVGTKLNKIEVEGDREYDGDDFLALLSLIISDGYAGSSADTMNLVSFCCFKESRYKMVAELAARMGFSEQPSRKGVWNRYSASLARWVRANCYLGKPYRSHNKKLPDLVKVCSERQIGKFLKYFGDQNHDGTQEVFYSSSRALADGLQGLLLQVGKRATLTSRGPRRAVMDNGQIIDSKDSHVLIVASGDKLCIDRKKHIERDKYKGLVYCAGVANGTLITRREGTSLISSNCWGHSSTQAVTILRAVNGLPYIPLSAYSICATIKKGRDEGGWGAQSLEFISTRGVASQAIWPQGDRDYRKYDKPETWANAALHKVTEGWVDLQAAQYDRKLTFDQVGTLLLMRNPTVNDYSWWSHSVMGLDLVDGATMWGEMREDSGKVFSFRDFTKLWGFDTVTGGYGVRILNSWGNWEDRGMGVLAANKAVPDGAVAPRVTTPSVV